MPHIPGRPTEGHGASVKPKRPQIMNPGQAQRTGKNTKPTSPELQRLLASLGSTAAPGFGADERRLIMDSMLRPEGNGKVTSKADGTITFDIRPDQSPGGAANVTTAPAFQWGDLDPGALQAIADANNAASGVDDSPVVEKTPQQHANEYLKMLEGLGSDEARVQFGLDPMGDGSVPGFLGDDAAALLRTGVGGLGEPAATSKYEWVDGKIKVKPEGDKTLVCDPGYHLENGKCVPDTAETKKCGPGEHLENGVCVPDAVQVEECGVGEVRNAAGV